MYLELISKKLGILNKKWQRRCENMLKQWSVWFRVYLQHWDCAWGFQEELCGTCTFFQPNLLVFHWVYGVCIHKLMRTVGKSNISMKILILMIKSDFRDQVCFAPWEKLLSQFIMCPAHLGMWGRLGRIDEVNITPNLPTLDCKSLTPLLILLFLNRFLH